MCIKCIDDLWQSLFHDKSEKEDEQYMCFGLKNISLVYFNKINKT